MSIGNDLGTVANDLSNPVGAAVSLDKSVFSFIASPTSWLSSLGADIGSGIEGGIVALLQDLWDVVVGPLLVIAGVMVFFWVVFIYFGADLADVVEKAAGLAAMAVK